MNLSFTDCVDIVGSAVPAFEGTKKYISTGALEDDHIDFSQVENVTYANKPSRANLACLQGDIVFAKMQGTRKTLLLNQESAEYIYSTGFCAVRAKESIIMKRCLYHLITSDYFLSQKDKYCSGSTQKAITNSGLQKIMISVPKMEKQNALSDYFDKIDDSIHLCYAILKKLDLLVKSRFIELFRIGKYEPVKLKTVCSKITDGTHKTPNYLSEGIIFISAKNIVNNELNLSDVKYISEDEYNEIQKRCQTEIYDILLSKSGSLGSPVILKTNEQLGLFESLAVIKYDKTKLLPEFLCEQLKTEEVQRQFKIGTKGVTIKHLHLNVIGDTDIIVPSLELQTQFVEFVQSVDKSKLAVKQVLEKAETLKKSLMQEYFAY